MSRKIVFFPHQTLPKKDRFHACMERRVIEFGGHAVYGRLQCNVVTDVRLGRERSSREEGR